MSSRFTGSGYEYVEPDDEKIFFVFRNNKDFRGTLESIEVLKRLREECGEGPFWGRKFLKDKIVLINPRTRKSVHKDDAGYSSIDISFVEEI